MLTGEVLKLANCAGGTELKSVAPALEGLFYYNMLRALFCLGLFCAFSVTRAAVPAFNAQFQTLRIPFVKGMAWDGSVNPVEATILGEFYPQGGQPVIVAEDAVENPQQSPYALLASFLQMAKDGGEERAMMALYSPDSQAMIATFLTDPELRHRQAEVLGQLRKLTVLGGWAEAPNRYILYARSNDDKTSVMPFMFEWLDGRWNLVAGSLDSQLSNQLDVFYFNPDPNGSPIEVISPPSPEAVRTLLAGEGMAAFAAQLGVALPEKDSVK